MNKVQGLQLQSIISVNPPELSPVDSVEPPTYALDPMVYVFVAGFLAGLSFTKYVLD